MQPNSSTLAITSTGAGTLRIRLVALLTLLPLLLSFIQTRAGRARPRRPRASRAQLKQLRQGVRAQTTAPAPSDPTPGQRAATPEPHGADGQPRPPQEGRAPALGSESIPPGTAAVVIAARNEESVIAATLESICRVYWRSDIYVFCDACTDATAAIARAYLPATNVIEHTTNIGKSRGLEYMLRNVIFPAGYVYVTFADADTTMEDGFLVETLKVLRKKEVACAVGQVKSRWYPNNLISVYRTFIYTLW